MSKLIAIIIASLIFLSAMAGYAECFEIRLISPIGAVARSTIPGWGQFYTHHKLRGVFVFLSISALGGLGIQEDTEYRHFYNDLYRDAVYTGSDKAKYYFDKANEHYKLSRFYLYAAAGIWAYSIIDAYIDAHVYNAQQQMLMLDVDNQRLKPLKLED